MKKESDQDKILDFFKKRWEVGALVGIIILIIFLQLNVISGLRQLPGPLYGGDFYYHLGVISHLYDGGSIFENTQALGEYPWTPPMYHVSVYLLAKLSGLSPFQGVLYSNIFFTIVIGLLSYLLGNLLLKNRTLALTYSVLILSTGTLFYHYHVVRLITSLFFITMLFYSYNKRKKWSTILAGVSYGLVMIAHASAGVAASYFLMLYYAYILFFQYLGFSRLRISFKLKRAKEDFKDNMTFCAIIFSVGFVIGLLYWFVPIVILHLATPNKLQEYTYVRLDSLYYQLRFGTQNLTNLFKMDFSNRFFHGLITILFIPGLIYTVFSKGTREIRYLRFLLVATVLGVYHPVITQNLFGFNLTPGSLGGFAVAAFKGILAMIGLKMVVELIAKSYRPLKVYRQWIFILCFIFLFSVGSLGYTTLKTSSPYYENAKQPMPEYLSDISSWIRQNTDVRDVFLTDNEDAFMLNALTGRKMLTSRRGHFGMFVDVDPRFMDAAIILHGNSDEKREELLRKNNAKYLFWHIRWLQNEFTTDEQGKVVHFFDPLLLKYNEDYENSLKEYNITYQKLNTWLDPALRSDLYLTYDALLVYPNFNVTHPWSESLDKYLKLEKTFYFQGTEAAKIYRIVI